MKLAFLVGCLPIGGLEKVTVQIANLMAKNHEVSLIILEDNTNNYEIDSKIKIYEGHIKHNFTSKVFRKLNRMTLKNHYFTWHKEIKFLRECLAKNHYDFVIASDGFNSMMINYALYQNEMCQNTKAICWMHSDYHTYFNNYFKEYSQVLDWCLKQSAGVVALTKSDQELYKNHIDNAIAIYNPLTIHSPRKTNLENQEIVFVGRLVKETKGLDYILEIANLIKETGWKIRVVGTGEDEQWFVNEVQKLNLQETIIIHGVVKENIQAIYENASIFISTSRWEGFGLSITEAMACGLPVVSFKNSGPKEILNHGEYGILIDNYDVVNFAEALKELIYNKEQLVYFSEKSLIRSQAFNEVNIANQWNKYLEESLGN